MKLILGGRNKKNKMKQTPYNIWKYNKDGNERPLEEQLHRREADELIAKQHIAWYDKNPLTNNALRKAANRQRCVEHLNEIRSDIRTLQNKLK